MKAKAFVEDSIGTVRAFCAYNLFMLGECKRLFWDKSDAYRHSRESSKDLL